LLLKFDSCPIFSHTLYPLIHDIVKCYPQSIVYPFKLSYETLQLSTNDPQLKHQLELVRQKLDRQCPLINEFIHALHQLNPQQQLEIWSKQLFQYLGNESTTRDCEQLRHHLVRFKAMLFSDYAYTDDNNEEPKSASLASQDSVFGDGIDTRCTRVLSTTVRMQFKNLAEKEFDQLFGVQGELFSSITLVQAKTVLNSLNSKLKAISLSRTNINDYSTWFSSTFRQQHRSLSMRELEMPGQYTSKKKPIIEQHIRIVGFDAKLLILHSLRLPKRLTLRGHDERDYRFLVKAGEDLRQDQRIQALFHIMNDLYDRNGQYHQTNSTRMFVRTYQGTTRTCSSMSFSHCLFSSYTDVVDIRHDRMARSYTAIERTYR
jgi:DNA-dependent protein kinase catalytic subunit